MKVPSFFNNKIVRWVFLALAVMNIIGYLSTSAYECLLVFAVGYALTDNYCNNQSCSILGALFAANFVWGCGRVKETFVEAMKGAKEHAQDASSSATKAASAALCRVERCGAGCWGGSLQAQQAVTNLGFVASCPKESRTGCPSFP